MPVIILLAVLFCLSGCNAIGEGTVQGVEGFKAGWETGWEQDKADFKKIGDEFKALFDGGDDQG